MAKKKIRTIAGKQLGVALYTVDPPYSKESVGFLGKDDNPVSSLFLAEVWAIDNRDLAARKASALAVQTGKRYYPHTVIAGMANEDDLK